jgi:hypothetical protein
MSAASSASTPARRVAAPTRPASAPSARAAQGAPVAAAAVVAARFDHHDDEFRINLSDIPRMRESMDVEGLKPSLLSRLFDLIAPIKP